MLAPVAYHVPAKHLAVGEAILDRRNSRSVITNIFVDDETTIVCQTNTGSWYYFDQDKEVRIAA